MIWTEIKNSINSNLRKPLDKLIEEKALELSILLNEQHKKTYSIHKVENAGSLENDTEILNIQGKGWLRSLYSTLYAYGSNPFKLIVEVDGNKKINISNKNNGASAIFIIADVSEKYSSSFIPVRTGVNYMEIKDFYDISDNLVNNNFRTIAAMLYKSGLGVKFEKSLKITVQSYTSESGKIQCEYILE